MTGTIKVKPADGAYVAQPDRAGLPVPPEGAIVADTSYYRRAILTGDLVDIEEEAAAGDEPEGQAASAADPEPAPESADPPAAERRGRRGAAPEQE